MRRIIAALSFVPVIACASGSHCRSAGNEAATKPSSSTTPGLLEAVPAEVRALDNAPQKVSPSGQARITLLAQGHNAFVGKLELAAHAQVPEHQDPTEEYIHVLSGRATMTMNGQQYEIGPGTTIYMPAYATVSVQNGPEPLVGLQVFAGPEPARKYDAWQPVQTHGATAPNADEPAPAANQP
jgi:quercetin dioxygenase-like cupin family protein